MEIVVEQRGEVRIVRVRDAKLTYPVLTPFFAEVRRIVELGTRKLIVDLEAVAYVDSASIGCLIEVHNLLGERGGLLKLSCPRPRVRSMLSMALADKILEVYTEESAALAAFGVRERRSRARG